MLSRTVIHAVGVISSASLAMYMVGCKDDSCDDDGDCDDGQVCTNEECVTAPATTPAPATLTCPHASVVPNAGGTECVCAPGYMNINTGKTECDQCTAANVCPVDRATPTANGCVDDDQSTACAANTVLEASKCRCAVDCSGVSDSQPDDAGTACECTTGHINTGDDADGNPQCQDCSLATVCPSGRGTATANGCIDSAADSLCGTDTALVGCSCQACAAGSKPSADTSQCEACTLANVCPAGRGTATANGCIDDVDTEECAAGSTLEGCVCATCTVQNVCPVGRSNPTANGCIDDADDASCATETNTFDQPTCMCTSR